MTDIHTTNLFITTAQRKQLRQRLLNITESLLITLEIDPCGRQLVMACGQGTESTNREAVYAWLEKGICCESRLDVFTTETLVTALRRHLEHSIGAWCT